MSLKLNDLNLLYIDDILGYTDNLDVLFDKTFHETIQSENFVDHLKIFKEIFIDLIIVNIDDESLGGIKFINLIKKNAPDFPVIALSRKEPEKLADSLNEIGVDLLLHRPIETTAFKELLSLHEVEILSFANNREKRNIKDLDRSLEAEEAIKLYFKSVVTELMKYDRDIPVDRKMDFSIMKSFLFTAYNNLKALDLQILNDSLKIAKKKLDMAISLKEKMDKKTASSIEENYETIFLIKQIPYVNALQDLEESKEKIYKLLSEQKMLSKKIDTLKLSLKHTNEKNPDYGQMKNALNNLSKQHVDTIHSVRTLKDKSEGILQKLDEYRDKNYEEFKTTYLAFVGEIKEDISDTLNVLAYRFDKELWRSAKKSKPIQKFFYEARIEGLYSSKTYMKYYVGKLDISKAGEATAKLIRYIEKYNKKNPINIAVLGDEPEKVQRFKEIIEKIDFSIKVIGYLDPNKMVDQFKTYRFHLVIMDYSVSSTTAPKIIEALHKIYKTEVKETQFCINTFNIPLKTAETASQNLPFEIFFNNSANPVDLQTKVMQIL